MLFPTQSILTNYFQLMDLQLIKCQAQDPDISSPAAESDRCLFSSSSYLCARKSPYALHTVRSFPDVASESVPMFICLTMFISRPFKKDRLALCARVSDGGTHHTVARPRVWICYTIVPYKRRGNSGTGKDHQVSDLQGTHLVRKYPVLGTYPMASKASGGNHRDV